MGQSLALTLTHTLSPRLIHREGDQSGLVPPTRTPGERQAHTVSVAGVRASKDGWESGGWGRGRVHRGDLGGPQQPPRR